MDAMNNTEFMMVGILTNTVNTYRRGIEQLRSEDAQRENQMQKQIDDAHAILGALSEDIPFDFRSALIKGFTDKWGQRSVPNNELYNQIALKFGDRCDPEPKEKIKVSLSPLKPTPQPEEKAKPGRPSLIKKIYQRKKLG